MSYIKPPFKVAIGGTGATTAAGARTNLGVPATTAVMLLDGSQAMTGAMDAGGFNIGNLATPSTAAQAATKGYVDSVAQGLSPKPSCRLATAAALPSYTYNNGSSGVGATITATATGVLTVDGSAVAANDYILVKDETAGNAPYNGIYKCTTAGSVGVAYVLTRAVEMDLSTEFVGAYTYIESGTANSGRQYACTNTSAPTVGTTAISFTQINGGTTYSAGNGLQLSTNTFSVLANGSTIDVSASGIKVSDTYPGNTSLVTLGTVTTGTWNATTIGVAKGGTGTTSTPSNGQIPIGNGSTYTVANLTAGSGITVTNGSGSITLAVDTSVVVTLSATQTLTNKTLTDPKIRYTAAVKTASYTVTTSDYILVMETSTSSQSFTLPAGATGLQFILKNAATSTQTVTVTPNGSEKIDNASSYSLDIGDSVTLQWAPLATAGWVVL